MNTSTTAVAEEHISEGENAGLHSTGNTAMTRFNAVRHGILSQHLLLPWEEPEEHRQLLAALVEEHQPKGPTETHLVEEIAGIIWRKRRIHQAERSAHQTGLHHTIRFDRDLGEAATIHAEDNEPGDSVKHAVRATPERVAAEIAEIEEDDRMTRKALAIATASRKEAYKRALLALREDSREWWEQALEDSQDVQSGEEPEWFPDVDSLARFIETDLLPFIERQRKAVSNYDLVKQLVLGDAYSIGTMERLAKYETHLDRKLERMLAMLLRLKALRRETGG